MLFHEDVRKQTSFFVLSCFHISEGRYFVTIKNDFLLQHLTQISNILRERHADP